MKGIAKAYFETLVVWGAESVRNGQNTIEGIAKDLATVNGLMPRETEK